MAILSIVLVFSLDHYHTLDGPAHLYNADLIQRLLLGDDLVDNWFVINRSVIPNYTSYLIIQFFNSIFSPSLANKVFILVNVLIPPFLFYKLLRVLKFDGLFWALLLFPLSFSNALQNGFYNFSIGVIFFLSYLIFLFKSEKLNNRFFILNTLFLILLFYTHLYVFVLASIVFGVSFFEREILPQLLNRKKGSNQKYIVANVFKAILSLSPGVALFVLFYLKHPSYGEQFLSIAELTRKLIDFSSIISIHHGDESKHTSRIAVIVLLAFVYAVYSYFKSGADSYKSLIFIVLIALLTVFYYSMPDSMGYASFLSNRHQWYLLLFVLIFVSSTAFPKVIKVLLPIVFIYLHFKLLLIIYKYEQPFQRMISELYSVTEVVDEYSVIFPVSYADTWESGHASNYVGALKPLILLDNYEAAQDYFPLMWNTAHPKIDLDTVCSNKNALPKFTLSNNKDSILSPLYLAYSDHKMNWDSLCSLPINSSIKYRTDYVLLYSISD